MNNFSDTSKYINLVLFFTKGVSLKNWDHVGMFAREVALYKKLQNLGINITFTTYGKSSDLKYSNRIPNINICCNKWNLPKYFYEKMLPFLHIRELRRADIIKTNQMRGSDIALKCALLWKKPLISRMGYLLSDFELKKNGEDSQAYQESLTIEEKVFSRSKAIVTTTSDMKKEIKKRFPSFSKKKCNSKLRRYNAIFPERQTT